MSGAARNARAEALARVGERYEVRVLEPSPPTVAEGPWFADDPLAIESRDGGRPLVSPVGNGDLRWDDLVGEDPELGGWCADRWLACYRRLATAPPATVETRLSLHALGEHVLSPARERANGKIALRYTFDGFGTPFFGDDRQLRVKGTEIVSQDGDAANVEPLRTLAAAASFAGVALAVEDQDLEVDPSAARFLADWFGFATSVLEELRAEAGAELAPSRVQLWAEHFDVAVELGSEAEGLRAGYGCSPGDELHPEPYLYVVPWTAEPSGDLWQATAFSGAELAFAELVAAADQRGMALEFMRARRDALNA